MSEYLVMRKVTDAAVEKLADDRQLADLWEEIGIYNASSPRQAVGQAAEALGGVERVVGGTYRIVEAPDGRDYVGCIEFIVRERTVFDVEKPSRIPVEVAA